MPLGFLTKPGDPGYWLTHNGVDIANGIELGLSDVVGIVQGYEQGGVFGGLETALSIDQLLATVVGLSGGIATPVAIVAGVLAAIFGGSHDNPADMPDKYDTARYTQYVGELQGAADTAYALPYNPGTDPVQVLLGGRPMLKYIQDWAQQNVNAPNEEVRQEAQTLLNEYGDTGNGQLSFQHDIADESVIGGNLSGTYITIYDQASRDLGTVQFLDTAFPTAVAFPPSTVPYTPPENSGEGNTSYYA